MTEIDYSKSQMTVAFLIKDGRVLLIEKGRNLGQGYMVGVGGRKEEEDATIEDTACREIAEEIRVTATHLQKVAELAFEFPHKPTYGGRVTAYIVDAWTGEPQITDEAKRLEWYPYSALPLERMWHDNTIWLPKVLAGKQVRGRFVIGADMRVIEPYDLEEISF